MRECFFCKSVEDLWLAREIIQTLFSKVDTTGLIIAPTYTSRPNYYAICTKCKGERFK